MARIRSIKPETFSSYSLSQVSIEARFLFIGLWTEADDYGRMIDSPKRIAGAVFPHDDRMTEARVAKLLDDLEAIGSIYRYTAGDGRYLCVPNWEDHQKISHRGEERIPPPSEELPDSLRKVSGATPETLRPDLGPRNRDIGTGKRSAHSYSAAFLSVWETYPKKDDKGKAQRAYETTIRGRPGAEPANHDDIALAVQHYLKAKKGSDPKFLKNFATLLGPDEPWREFLPGSGASIVPIVLRCELCGKAHERTACPFEVTSDA